MRTLADLGPVTEAAILKAVYKAPYPRMALPDIALNHQVLLADLQTLLNRHGYPDKGRMLKAAQQLENEAAETTTPTDPTTPATAADGTQREQLIKALVADLHPDPDNVRDDASSDVEELALSIAEVGLVQPIIARRAGGKMIIVAGHRRLAAVRRLGWLEVDVVLRGAMRPDHIIAAMLIENGQRKDLDPIEEARGLRRLKVETGCTDLALAGKIGRSQPHVSGRLALLDLSPAEQEQIRTGELTLGNAVRQGRLNAGKVSKAGVDRDWHLSPTHDLATRAKSRCDRMKHKTGRRVGGTACGACWESVIRADERRHLGDYAIRTGTCTVCGSTPTKTEDHP